MSTGKKADSFKVSAESLAVLGEHHIIIASENGTLYKFKQSALPEVGYPLKNPRPSQREALEILRKTSGGPILAEGSSYYALNARAFHAPKPTGYRFTTKVKGPKTPKLPRHNFIIIPADNQAAEAGDPEASPSPADGSKAEDPTKEETVPYFIESKNLRSYRWDEEEGQKLQNAARQYVLNAIQHGWGVGLFPAVKAKDYDDFVVFIICFCINCRCFALD